jgi:hypothetical protein
MTFLPNPFVTEESEPVEESRFVLDAERFMLDIAPPRSDSSWLYELWDEAAGDLPVDRPLFLEKPSRRYG